MKLFILAPILVFATYVVGLPTDSVSEGEVAFQSQAITSDNFLELLQTSQGEGDELVDILVSGLSDYIKRLPADKLDETLESLEKRSAYPLLDHLFTTLKDTGLVNDVINTVLLHPTLLRIAADGTEFILRNNLINITNLLIAIDKSGLGGQVLNLTFEDPNVIPGLLRIGRNILTQWNSPETNSKRSTEYKGAVSQKLEETVRLVRRENLVENEIFQSLADSGLGISVVQNLLTNPEIASPVATFVVLVAKSHSISLGQILEAVRNSNILGGILGDLFKDSRDLLSNLGPLLSRVISGGILF